MSNETLKQDPCENCDLRKGFAIAFDMHFWAKAAHIKCDECGRVTEYIDLKRNGGKGRWKQSLQQFNPYI